MDKHRSHCNSATGTFKSFAQERYSVERFLGAIAYFDFWKGTKRCFPLYRRKKTCFPTLVYIFITTNNFKKEKNLLKLGGIWYYAPKFEDVFSSFDTMQILCFWYYDWGWSPILGIIPLSSPWVSNLWQIWRFWFFLKCFLKITPLADFIWKSLPEILQYFLYKCIFLKAPVFTQMVIRSSCIPASHILLFDSTVSIWSLSKSYFPRSSFLNNSFDRIFGGKHISFSDLYTFA
jgi:hypothetical protein